MLNDSNIRLSIRLLDRFNLGRCLFCRLLLGRLSGFLTGDEAAFDEFTQEHLQLGIALLLTRFHSVGTCLDAEAADVA